MADAISLGDMLKLARRRLAEAGIAEGDLDARLIVEHGTGASLLDFVARSDQLLPQAKVEAIEAMLARRAAREPVYRILGAREFYGLPMTLSPETLEPRADTETLVDAVLPFAQARAADGGCRILDLGAGTGAIVIALLANIPAARGLAVDISADALETTRRNADLNGVGARLDTQLSHWFTRVDGVFDLIVSNPPYIATSKLECLDEEVKAFDPPRALDGGPDGLDCYRAIAQEVSGHLAPNGQIGLEIGYDQHDGVVAIFERHGFLCREGRKDLGGNDRVVIFERRKEP